jgi:hypothetical protein
MNTTHRTGIISILALACFLLGFAPAAHAQGFNLSGIGPSKGQVIGAGIGAGAVITAAIVIPVLIIHNHHNIKGCILTADNGLQLRQDNAKSFTLTGITTYVKPGERVTLHGTRQKTSKGSSDVPTFLVDGVTKDYGSCKLPPPNTSLPSNPQP